MTQREFAKKLSVSQATISMALKDSPAISKELRDKIRQMAAEAGYSPNIAGQLLRRGKNNLLGVIFPKVQTTYYSDFLLEIFRCAQKLGYLVLLENIRNDEDVQTAVKNLTRYHVSGILAMCGEATLKYFDPSVPTVFLYGFSSENTSGWHSNVYFDMYQAGRVAGELLLKTGRKHMTYLGRALEWENRYRGFYEVCSLHKDIVINWVDGVQNDTECGYALTETLLKDFPETDVIIAHNDSMAFGALRRLWEAGISVPERMMIIGFDNAFMGRYSTPSLTSVGPDIGELASKAIQTILKSIEDPDFHCQIPVQCKVFLRESCGPVHQKSECCNKTQKNKE